MSMSPRRPRLRVPHALGIPAEQGASFGLGIVRQGVAADTP